MPSLEDPELIGGRYRILGPLGSGNMGDVHRAVHAVTGQKVALKILRAHVAQGHGGIKRFLREVQAAATIDHPGVVTVFDAGTHDDTLYIAMELLQGEGMGDKLKGDWPRAKAVAAMRSLLEPLAVAHEAGIIHRDLKPDNVFIAQGKDGEELVKLLDFGIAADQTNLGATQTGLTIGTPYYMSPEQAMDPRTCTGSADVWSFGVMLYEILAGKLPFDGATAHSVIINAINGEPEPLSDDVPAPLAALVMRCLEKRAADRPADARALIALFDEAAPDAAAGLAGPVTRTSSGPQAAVTTSTLSARRPALWPAWLALALVGGGLVAWLAFGSDRAPEPDDAAGVATPATQAPVTAAGASAAPATVTPSAAPSAAPDAAVPDAAAPDAVPPSAPATQAAPATASKRPARRRRRPATEAPKPTPPASKAPASKAPATAAAPVTQAAPVTAAAPASVVRVLPKTEPPPPPAPLAVTFGAPEIIGAIRATVVKQALGSVQTRIQSCVKALPPRQQGAKASVVFLFDADGFGRVGPGQGDPAAVACAKKSAGGMRLRRRPDTGEVRVVLPMTLKVQR